MKKKSLLISKEVRILAANFCSFWKKPINLCKFLRKFWFLHTRILIDNWFFTHFLSDLQGPVSFNTTLENNTIFLQHFFGFAGGGIFPLPLRAPLQVECSVFKGSIQNVRKFPFSWRKLIFGIDIQRNPLHKYKLTIHMFQLCCTEGRPQGRERSPRKQKKCSENGIIFQNCLKWERSWKME